MADETSERPGETAVTADETGTNQDETHETADETHETTSETHETADGNRETADETGTRQDETADETSTRQDETADETGETPDETGESPDETGETGAGGSRARRAAVVLGAVTVVLAAFGVWATLAAHSLRGTAAPQNVAVTDGPATSAVRQQIAKAVNTVFSYSYADTAATRRAAQSVLTGPAIRQYNTYFALVTKEAPAQKLVVTTRVTNSGVELLTGSQARVLVFANQQDTRAGTKQTSYAGALFAVTAVRQGGRWKIENIDTFNGQA